jgi:glycosyltransferase involved in cell wall biosynthesis
VVNGGYTAGDSLPPMRTALVHDFLVDLRGAERVFAALCDLFPGARVFTSVYDEEGTRGRFAHREVVTTPLQRLRPTKRSFRSLLPLYPRAIEGLDLTGYDLVISSSSGWAHGVRTDPAAVHVCYCHNPFRYAWDREAALAGRDPVSRRLLTGILDRWRDWDRRAAGRVTRYVANSQATRRRIAECFDRQAAVVYPPVELERFAPGPVGDHYLVLSALMRHKRIGVAVEAFNRLGLPLVIVGEGPDMRRLRRMAAPNVRFEGRVSDPDVAVLLSAARALIVPSTEEFGIAAVEAQAAGRPVIALRAGGLRETVAEGITGVFFEKPTPEALAEAVRCFDPLAVDPSLCVASAQRFGRERFADEMRWVVTDAAVDGAARPQPLEEPVR